MAKKKSRPKHIPALDELQLETALARLQVSTLSGDGKRLIESMLRAAANPDAERIDVVIANLEEERRGNVEETARTLNRSTANVTSRARRALQAMNNDEWDKLVEEANKE